MFGNTVKCMCCYAKALSGKKSVPTTSCMPVRLCFSGASRNRLAASSSRSANSAFVISPGSVFPMPDCKSEGWRTAT
jgi:hypothetical protein